MRDGEGFCGAHHLWIIFVHGCVFLSTDDSPVMIAEDK